MSGATNSARGHPLCELILPSTKLCQMRGALLMGMVGGQVSGIAGAILETTADDNIL
jgi:hypothetical protein